MKWRGREQSTNVEDGPTKRVTVNWTREPSSVDVFVARDGSLISETFIRTSGEQPLNIGVESEDPSMFSQFFGTGDYTLTNAQTVVLQKLCRSKRARVVVESQDGALKDYLQALFGTK